MDGIFIDFYNKLVSEIDNSLNKTHKINDNEKEDIKKEFRKMLNSDPEKLEPLFSRLAKCKAYKTRHFLVSIYDYNTDKIFTNVWEALNGKCEAGFNDVSILVEFEDGDDYLDESVYIRFDYDYERFYIYDLKPNIVEYKKNSDTTQDTSKYGMFKEEYPEYAKYIEKWEKSGKNVSKELDKWKDMLWLGRSLALCPGYDEETKKTVEAIQNKVIERWKDDPDFKRCMYEQNTIEASEEFGDSQWEEISCNVGALRYLLYGEWNLDS